MPGARPKRSRRRRPPNVIANDGTWIGVARRNDRPADYAHRIDKTLPTGAVTVCSLFGRAIPIAAGVEVNACPRCLASADIVITKENHDRLA
jgi:hypothetical protein